MTTLILLAVVLGLGYRITTPEDRERLLAQFLETVKHTRKVAGQKRLESEPFREMLRKRTRFSVVTPALIALNVIVFIGMLRGAGALTDPETLVAWGASFGPKTTNPQWWRIVASMFVHNGFLQLAINMCALAQVGMLLERLVGRPTVVAVYMMSGIFAALVSLSSYPIGISFGASGAIFGIWGLFAAVLAWNVFQPDAPPVDPEDVIDEAAEPFIKIPLMVARRLTPMFVIFVLYNLVNDALPFSAELTGFVVGLVGGLILTKSANESRTPGPLVAAVGAVAFVVALACAVPLRGIADVRPEMASIVALEDQTSHVYQTAADQFRRGRLTAEGLAGVIEQTIMPKLQAADAHLKSLTRVPAENQPLVADAQEYVKLRSESWHLRAEGLRKAAAPTVRKVSRTDRESDESWRMRTESQYRGNLAMLGKAEGAERASLAALDRVKSAEQK